ncbi:MAG: M48 family metallopeptidase [Fluviibacter sp.]
MQFMSEAYKKGVVGNQAEDKELSDYVNKAGLAVLKASGLASKQNWEIVLIRSDVANAFVLPNGKIVVYTGLLPVAKNEAGLAAVIGHEIAHVSSKHTAERLSQTMASNVSLNAANVYLDKNKSQYSQKIAAALAFGVEYGLLLPYSREHENEADLIGQVYMAKAGYDPKEAIYIWQRMAANDVNAPPEFLSTHPSNRARINNLSKLRISRESDRCYTKA